MAFNRLADRRIDALNPRTAMRHLPAGRLSVALGRGLHGGERRGVRGVDALVLAEPLAARSCRCRCCSGCWATRTRSGSPAWRTSGWARRWPWRRSRPGSRLRGDLAWPPVLLGLAVLFWVAGFDIIYACQDVDFDRAHGLHSLPARLGRPRPCAWRRPAMPR